MNLDKNILGIQFLNEKVRRLFLKLRKKDEKHS